MDAYHLQSELPANCHNEVILLSSSLYRGHSYSLIHALNGIMVKMTFQLLLPLASLMTILLLLLIYGSSLAHITRTMKLKGPCPQRCNNASLSNGNWMADSIPEKPILWPNRSLPPTTAAAPPPHSSNNAVTDSSLSQGSDWQGRGLIPNHFVGWHGNDSDPSPRGWDGPTWFYCRAGGEEFFFFYAVWI